MSNVTTLAKKDASLLPAAEKLVWELDDKIGLAIKEAKEAGLAQGMIVAIIHSHSTAETLGLLS